MSASKMTRVLLYATMVNVRLTKRNTAVRKFCIQTRERLLLDAMVRANKIFPEHTSFGSLFFWHELFLIVYGEYPRDSRGSASDPRWTALLKYGYILLKKHKKLFAEGRQNLITQKAAE